MTDREQQAIEAAARAISEEEIGHDAGWQRFILQARAAIEAYLAVTSLREDAERWRYWLREHGWSGYFDGGASNSESDADIIAAIDAARSDENG